MVIIKGSGVNLDEFKYSTLKNRKSYHDIRIIKDKGLEFAEAHILKKNLMVTLF